MPSETQLHIVVFLPKCVNCQVKKIKQRLGSCSRLKEAKNHERLRSLWSWGSILFSGKDMNRIIGKKLLDGSKKLDDRVLDGSIFSSVHFLDFDVKGIRIHHPKKMLLWYEDCYDLPESSKQFPFVKVYKSTFLYQDEKNSSSLEMKHQQAQWACINKPYIKHSIQLLITALQFIALWSQTLCYC